MMLLNAILTHNNEKHIGQLLESTRGLLGDIVVFDDGSTDNTVAIAETNGFDIMGYTHEGSIKNHNRALSAADGGYDLLRIIHGDDLVVPAVCNEQVAQHDNFIGASVSQHIPFYDDANPPHPQPRNGEITPSDSERVLKSLWINSFGPPPCFVLPESVISEYRFDPRINYRGELDLIFWMAANDIPIGLFSSPAILKRGRNGAKSNMIDLDVFYGETIYLVRKYKDFIYANL